MKIRYIRAWSNGNSYNDNNEWTEIKAFDRNGTNIALDKGCTFSNGTKTNMVTDNEITKNFSTGTGLQNAKIDLGDIFNIETIVIWRYLEGSLTFKETDVEVSTDSLNWIKVYDSKVEGEYVETEKGKTIILPVDSIPPLSEEPLQNTSSLDSAIKRFGVLDNYIDSCVNVLSDTLIDKGVDVLETDKMSNLINKVGTISTGKKWAEGRVEGNYSAFQSLKDLVVTTNLPFTPSRIIINFDNRFHVRSSSGGILNNFAQNFTVDSKTAYSNTNKALVCTSSSSNTGGCYIYNIRSDSFTLKYGAMAYNTTNIGDGGVMFDGFTWEAYE